MSIKNDSEKCIKVIDSNNIFKEKRYIQVGNEEDTKFGVNHVLGSICFPSSDARYADDGTFFLGATSLYGDDTNEFPSVIKGYSYGTSRYNTVPLVGTATLNTPGAFDAWSTYFTLSSYRSNYYLDLLDSSGNRVGYIKSTKDSSTWSRGDYSTFSFYLDNGTHVVEFGANLFAGNSYGNGAQYLSIDMRDPSKIVIRPHSYNSSSHYFYADRTIAVAHPFSAIAQVRLRDVYQYSYYSNSPTWIKIASYNAFANIANRV